MPFSNNRYCLNALLVCFLLVAMPEANACKVPVFRYALEHWYPDPYQAMVLHKRPLSNDDEALVVKLKSLSSNPKSFANLRVSDIDVEKEDEVQVLSELLGPDYEKQIDSPEIVLLYPRSSQRGQLAWRGSLTSENIDALVNSPARRQITDLILAGESAVWVLIGVGDAEKDKLAEETLRTELALLEKKLELRDIEIIEAESEFGQGTKVELRLGLKLLVLDRDDPQETIFVTTLLNSADDIDEFDEPVAIPVYGRGRAFLALSGSKINSGNIEDSCRFLIGDCSCEVKRFNPGVDLLFDINWDDLVVGSADIDQPLPLLEGIGLYAEISLDEDDSVVLIPETGPATERSGRNSPDRPTAKTEVITTQTPQMPSEGAPKQGEISASQHASDDTSSPSSTFGKRLTLWLVALIALGIVLVGITTARLRS